MKNFAACTSMLVMVIAMAVLRVSSARAVNHKQHHKHRGQIKLTTPPHHLQNGSNSNITELLRLIHEEADRLKLLPKLKDVKVMYDQGKESLCNTTENFFCRAKKSLTQREHPEFHKLIRLLTSYIKTIHCHTHSTQAQEEVLLNKLLIDISYCADVNS